MKAYFHNPLKGEILEVLEYEKLTPDIFHSMCIDAMDYLKEDLKTEEGRLYGAEFCWTSNHDRSLKTSKDWRLEAFSFGEGCGTFLILFRFGSRSCYLRTDF